MTNAEEEKGAVVDGVRQRKTANVTQFEIRLEQINTDLKNIEGKETRYERNVARREVWRDSEILLMDLEDAGVIVEGDKDNEWARKTTEIKKHLTIEELEYKLDALNKLFMYLRLAAMTLWLMGGLWIIFICLPLRWFHPALRRLGVPNDYLPIDLLQKMTAKMLIHSAGAVVSVEGLDKRPYPPVEPYITMFAHPSNLDPMMLLSSSPVIHKGVGKQSLFMIPVMGWAFRFSMGSIPLDRGSLTKAKQQLQRLKVSMQRWRRCVFISPEGTRQPQGQLQPFKKGAFHLQADLGCPISPIVHFGPFELWPRKRLMNAPGHVTIRYLPLYYPEKGADHNTVRRDLRKIMLKASCENIPKSAALLHRTHSFKSWDTYQLDVDRYRYQSL
eukprot:CFRG0637T1